MEGGEFQLHCFIPSSLDRGDWLCLMSSKSGNYRAFDFKKTERFDRIVYTVFCFNRYFNFQLQDLLVFVQFLQAKSDGHAGTVKVRTVLCTCR